MSYVVVYVTFPNKKSARSITHHLLKKKLIVCSNIFAVNSEYCWENKIAKSKETVALMKTNNAKFKKVEREIIRSHPYKVPVIEKIKVTSNSSAEKWVRNYLK